MKTELVETAAVPSYDDDVVEALRRCRFDDCGERGRIGLLNDQGEIYRAIETRGVAEFVGVLQCLLARGFRDTGAPARSDWLMLMAR